MLNEAVYSNRVVEFTYEHLNWFLQHLYMVPNIVRTASLTISTSRRQRHYQNAAQLFRHWLDEVRKTGKYVLSAQKNQQCEHS